MKGVCTFRHGSTPSWVCHIESFSDDLQNELRARLTSVCHGEDKADSTSKIYSYKATLKEFLRRYEHKSAETKKGMIGELLSHIILLKEFPNFTPASPYFNMEEGSIKKGFDVIVFDKNKHGIWITEVKSGEADNHNSDTKNMSLINKAKNDLKARLNESDITVWLNAINGAALALKRGRLKEQVNGILKSIADAVEDGKASSVDKDVILISVLFNPLRYKITMDTVSKKHASIVKEDLFAKVIVFSIQKATYHKVVAFLKSEAIL